MSKLPAALAADGSEGGGTRQTHEACLRLIKSALHLAVMKREHALFCYMLASGADVFARACGNFFLPTPQTRFQARV